MVIISGDVERENISNSFIIQLDSDLNYCGDMQTQSITLEVGGTTAHPELIN